ncbi:diguanylate cyclase [Thalassotalea psychrophila]|uniref:diguanylate cyclase n=1 Tax=Thalassotalea psychrophila TaxID=3065647 RepID=A0ABY9TV95_9GAMM|nr:diguanylate cyclase [Colwelliaceae bacterium SQ149]
MNIKVFNNLLKIMLLGIICLTTLPSFSAEAQKVLLVDGLEDGTSIKGSIKYLLDEQSSLTAEQVWQKESFFKESNEDNSWLGNIAGSVWNKFIIKNDGNSPIVIHIEYPYHQPSTVVLYQRTLGSEQGFSSTKDSLFESASDRSIAFPRVALPLELQPQQSIEVLLETFSDVASPRFAEFRIWSTKSIVKASNIEHVIFAIVVSFIIISALISFALFNFLKEKFFLWYSLFAISSLPVLGLTTGILNLYVPNLGYHPLGTISMVIMMAAGIQFMRVYSNASYHSIIADKVMHLTLTLVLIALPIAIIGFHELAMQIQQLAIFTFPAAIIAAIYCGSLGEKKITTMVLAKTLFFIILLSTNLQAWGWVSPSYGLVFLPTIGMLAQLICLIWAMYGKATAHYNFGSSEDLDTVSNAYEKAYALQEQVKQQNQMLKAAKEQAEFEARTDMLTQLPNRRAFMNLAKMAIAQANRQEKPLAFIAFDIDNFKLINDQYGHPAGDQTLKEVGDLTRSIIRASDFCGRIGGEEFMIGCHNNTLGDAYNLAERIRKAIENCVIKFDGLEFSTTVSLGLAQVEEDDTLETVIKKADEAMYLSKADGKNKVSHYAA